MTLRQGSIAAYGLVAIVAIAREYYWMAGMFIVLGVLKAMISTSSVARSRSR
ncbi:MAG: hypothetical protein Q7S02_02640 [bacterium]|nr:hypothetical protein [bacterium]